MKPFRVLVADDEPLARTMVTDMLRRDREIETVIECGDARKARETLEAGEVDIAFLDIEMPEANGLDIAKATGLARPVIVFVTAFGQYATNAFDVDATDYVLKPFSDARLLEALERAKTRVRERRLRGLAEQMATISAELREDPSAQVESSRHPRRLSFKQGDRSILLNVTDILWIEAEDYYVLIHARTGRHMVRATLQSLEDRLDPKIFLRVHRAAIVNIDEVREAHDEGQILVLSDGSRVAVSRSRRHAVQSALQPGPSRTRRDADSRHG